MVAVIPFVATGMMIAAGMSRRADERYRLYASIAWPVLAGTLGLVAIVGTAIVLDGAEGVNERYVFYLVPLLLIGLAAWFEAKPGRGRLALLILTAAVVVVALLPFDDLAADATFYAPSLAPWVALAPPGVLGQLLVGSALLALGVLWLWLGARGARAVTIWTASWLALVAIVAAGAYRQHADTAMATLVGVGPTWIDDAVPAGEPVAVLWDQRSPASAPDPHYFPLMVAAALNDSVGRFLRLGNDTFYEKWLPTTHVDVGPRRHPRRCGRETRPGAVRSRPLLSRSRRPHRCPRRGRPAQSRPHRRRPLAPPWGLRGRRARTMAPTSAILARRGRGAGATAVT